MKKKIEKEEGILSSAKTHKILSKFKFIPIALFSLGTLITLAILILFAVVPSSEPTPIGTLIVGEIFLFIILESVVVISLIPFFVVWFIIELIKGKIKVLEDKIVGKKGFKKFDITYDKITHLDKIDKKLIIQTKERKIVLNSLENINEIYYMIRSRVAEDVYAPRVVVKKAVPQTAPATPKTTPATDKIKDLLD